jgi:Inosine-uridine nucleoside N-ribohydrolase
MIYNNYSFSISKEKMMRVIIDTDAKNEADDQYAIVHALLSPKLDNVGFIAAHYGTEEGSVDRSYAELEKIFDLMHFNKDGMLYHGANVAMQNEYIAENSEGARLIINEALKDDERPLFVLFLGSLTDLASAYLLEPRIAKRMTAIWIGGGPYPCGGNEYNLWNDINAANVVFSSSIELWQIPQNAYKQASVSLAELEYRVRPHGEIGKYLFEQLDEFNNSEGVRKSSYFTGEKWILGDSPAIGLLLYEDCSNYKWQQAPRIAADMTYVHNGLNRPIRVYDSIDYRLLLEDFYCKLALFAQRHFPNSPFLHND